MTRFLIVPQWQGSPSARAMLLVDGASAIAGDLPRRQTTMLDVPLEAGEALGTDVRRLSSLRRVRELVAEHLHAEHPGDADEQLVVIGGDCSVTVAALSAVDTSDLAVLWCDAHPDLNDPSSSPSGAFSGMALAAILGDGEPQLALQPGVPAERVVLLGARSVDASERSRLGAVRTISADDAEDPDAVVAAVRATGAARVWVHIDVDVIDPSELEGVSDAEPFGVRAAALAAAVRQLREHLPLAGATIAGFAPRTPLDAVRDLGVILRLIGSVA
ncbi:arginase family protein [Microbacterium sp. ARD32]|uniref:arginase family protein n=1 Tax=Microbacterium sp. ARD32 TaxID=2962577 RepID=UPI0028813476|nr:arginase family protein [Microbacterium sp. ARD32]MDT0156839.1 arginase family protein [Microbacterium sp. ARD32]